MKRFLVGYSKILYPFDFAVYNNVCVRIANQLEDYILNRRIIIDEKEMYGDYDLLVEN